MKSKVKSEKIIQFPLNQKIIKQQKEMKNLMFVDKEKAYKYIRSVFGWGALLIAMGNHWKSPEITDWGNKIQLLGKELAALFDFSIEDVGKYFI